MKRLLSGVTAAILALTIMGTTYNVKAMTMEQADQLVEMTNNEINKDIENAVNQANDLVSEYQDAIINASKVEDAQKVQDNIMDVVNALNILSNSYSRTTVPNEISKNIKGLDRNLDFFRRDIKNAGVSRNVYYNYNKLDYDELYDEFNAKLDKIIYDLIEETNQKVEDLKAELAKSGIIIESEWISVNIGGRIVLVDPCRVVGF